MSAMPLRPSENNAGGRGLGQLLTADQLAQRWQVPKSHVYRLTRDRAIPAVKLGRYYRYRIDAIERFEIGDASHTETAA
jgi:excisionase family DNA binding protein